MEGTVFRNRLHGLRCNGEVDQDALALQPVGRETVEAGRESLSERNGFLVAPCSVRDRTPRRRPQGDG